MSEDNSDINAFLDSDIPEVKKEITDTLLEDAITVISDIRKKIEKTDVIDEVSNSNETIEESDAMETDDGQYFQAPITDKYKYTVNINDVIDRPYEPTTPTKKEEGKEEQNDKMDVEDDSLKLDFFNEEFEKSIGDLKRTEIMDKAKELLKKMRNNEINFTDFIKEVAAVTDMDSSEEEETEETKNKDLFIEFDESSREKLEELDKELTNSLIKKAGQTYFGSPFTISGMPGYTYKKIPKPESDNITSEKSGNNTQRSDNDTQKGDNETDTYKDSNIVRKKPVKKMKKPRKTEETDEEDEESDEDYLDGFDEPEPEPEPYPIYNDDGNEYKRECNCPSCTRQREQMEWRKKPIPPIMSYDRSRFPEPNRDSSRMARITWAYPKYTEELSVEEFQQILDARLKDMETEETTTEPKTEEVMETETKETTTDNDSFDDDELTCPISFETLDETNIAMTCYGQYYEINTIRDWMMEHDTDPIARRFLYTKALITKGIDLKNIKVSQKKIQQNMLILSNYPHELIYPDNKIKEIKKTQQTIRNFEGEIREMWTQYCIDKLSYFRNPDVSKQTIPRNRYLNQNGDYPRPEGTGKDFEYMDLSGDYFNKFQHINQNFKGTSFNGADLSNNVFVQCAFNRCTFVGANIASTVFHGCSFLGEEVNFADASVSDETQFIDCSAENIGDWTRWTDPQMVKLCFKNRYLEGPYSVISLGFDEGY